MPDRQEKSTPAPLETEPGKQQDDNIDDLGHRPDGSNQDQPEASEPDHKEKPRKSD